MCVCVCMGGVVLWLQSGFQMTVVPHYDEMTLTRDPMQDQPSSAAPKCLTHKNWDIRFIVLGYVLGVIC